MATAMLVLLNGVVCAQEKPAPQQRAASATALAPGATILSDTQGVDFSAYLRRLHEDIQRNWDPLIPAKVQTQDLKKGIVGIRFSILPDGRIGAMKLETTSGDRDLDKAAWYAITSEGQFPALPRKFHGPGLELRVGFFYNEPIQQAQPSATQNTAPSGRGR